MQWLAEICVHRPVFATVIVLFLTVVGGFAFFTLGVDRFPKIDLPTISVSTSNPGAAPEEMETEITDVIEGALNTVPGVDEMRSSLATRQLERYAYLQSRKRSGRGVSGGPAKTQHRRQSPARNCRSAGCSKERSRFAADPDVLDQCAARRDGADRARRKSRCRSASNRPTASAKCFMWGARTPQIQCKCKPGPAARVQPSGHRSFGGDPLAKSGNAGRQHHRRTANAWAFGR